MKGVIWFLGLASSAVALALLMGSNNANVTLYWHPYRVDVSFNLALLAVLAFFVLFYGAMRAVALLRSLPQQAQRWRIYQMERKAMMAVLDALAYQLSGRFVRTQSAARRALAQLQLMGEDHPFVGREQVHVLAYLLAAESAQALGNTEQRDRWLRQALEGVPAKIAPEAREGALLCAATWALDGQDASAARQWLDELPQGVTRRIQALRLKLRLARLEQDNASAIDLIRLLTKHRAYSAQASHSLLRGLVLDSVRTSHDTAHLRQLWRGLDVSERSMPELAIAVLEQWRRLQADASSQEVDPLEQHFVEECLESAWTGYSEMTDGIRQRLLLCMESILPLLTGDWLAQIEQAQQRLPHDAGLQYLAGQVFLQRQLWGKAAFFLGQASVHLKDTELARRAWRGLAQLAEERGDLQTAQTAWKQAALL